MDVTTKELSDMLKFTPLEFKTAMMAFLIVSAH